MTYRSARLDERGPQYHRLVTPYFIERIARAMTVKDSHSQTAAFEQLVRRVWEWKIGLV
jgi:hypothetical protein